MIHPAAMSTLVLLFGLTAVWGTSALGWLAARRVARRRGLTLLAAFLDHATWEAEPILGIRARVLLPMWFVGWAAATFVAFAWRP